jgi:hypothetical protein
MCRRRRPRPACNNVIILHILTALQRQFFIFYLFSTTHTHAQQHTHGRFAGAACDVCAPRSLPARANKQFIIVLVMNFPDNEMQFHGQPFASAAH